MELDIPAFDKKNSEIFGQILEGGTPKTAYDLSDHGRYIATTLRHTEDMMDRGFLQVYEIKKENSSGRPKKPYGPTFYGIVENCVQDPQNIKKLGKIFDEWKNNTYFQSILISIGLDEEKVKNEPDFCKKIFAKMVYFHVGCFVEFDNLIHDPESIDINMMLMIGSMLAYDKKNYQKIFAQLYTNLPAFKKSMNMIYELFIANIENYKKIKQVPLD